MHPPHSRESLAGGSDEWGRGLGWRLRNAAFKRRQRTAKQQLGPDPGVSEKESEGVEIRRWVLTRVEEAMK